MSNDKQKDANLDKPKKVDGADSAELDSESLDGVSGGMRPAFPDFGAAKLPTGETDVCISQQ